MTAIETERRGSVIVVLLLWWVGLGEGLIDRVWWWIVRVIGGEVGYRSRFFLFHGESHWVIPRLEVLYVNRKVCSEGDIDVKLGRELDQQRNFEGNPKR